MKGNIVKDDEGKIIFVPDEKGKWILIEPDTILEASKLGIVHDPIIYNEHY